ncbi:MAG: NnrS family protein, partial [Stellaceae bacterium]
MVAIPRYRACAGTALLSAGFRPFFLLSTAWAALAVPLWLIFFAGAGAVPTLLPPPIWHAHEMIYGYAAATVAGFLLTAIPNWTGRMPLQGASLAALAILWIAGRIGVLLSAEFGAAGAATLDLAFPVALLAAVAREIAVGRNWRNLPMVAALMVLLAGNALVHVEALGWASTGELGDRIGIATLLMLMSL